MCGMSEMMPQRMLTDTALYWSLTSQYLPHRICLPPWMLQDKTESSCHFTSPISVQMFVQIGSWH